jgi:ATP-dependent Clp protease ATP-binding subunit ClpB
VLIMTSNIGSPIIQQYFLDGKTSVKELAAMETAVKNELRSHFRPEFLNRVDDIIIFRSLDEEQLSRIIDIQLQRVEKRLAAQQITIELTAAAKALLAQEGYDPQFGARPLKRSIQEHLLDPLAMKILDGEIKAGSHVKVGAKEGALQFTA